MTCIIGYLDKKKNVGWIGGDSCSSHPKLSTQDIVKVPKVFRSVQFEDVLIGCTTSFRNMDLLHYNDLLFDGVENSSQIDHRFMVTNVIPKVIDIFNDGIPDSDPGNKGANFIVVTPFHIFEIQNDYSVTESESNFNCIGSGFITAMASLFTLSELNTELDMTNKIRVALDVTEKIVQGVQKPFHILSTKGHDEIIKDNWRLIK